MNINKPFTISFMFLWGPSLSLVAIQPFWEVYNSSQNKNATEKNLLDYDILSIFSRTIEPFWEIYNSSQNKNRTILSQKEKSPEGENKKFLKYILDNEKSFKYDISALESILKNTSK